MTTKKEAQRQARQLRYQMRKNRMKKLTVNVKEISKGNWGVRFSQRGTRDRLDFRKRR